MSKTQTLLRELDLRPLKGLGQNFLVDTSVLERILRAAELEANDTVLEIGAGLGVLTATLAEHAKRVVAVEVDKRLEPILRERLSGFSNVEIVRGDILALDIADLVGTSAPRSTPDYKVVANLPYYITSAVLRKLLEVRVMPLHIVLMVQREVAQRITAIPGAMSLLAVSVQFYGKPAVVARVPAGAFYPAPKVDSAIIRVDPYSQLPIAADDIAPFFELVRAGFGQKRKQLRNALQHGLHLPAERIAACPAAAGIDGQRRAETLSVEEWVTLHRALHPAVD